MPARIARVSFIGELSFEINVRARDLLTLWAAGMEAGASRNYASRFRNQSCAESGKRICFARARGRWNCGPVRPWHELYHVEERRRLCRSQIGAAATRVPKAAQRIGGLLAKDLKRMLAEGAPLTPMGKKSAAEGFVSASVWTVVHERPISFALLADGRRRMGESVFVRELDDVAEAAVVAPCFYDPPGRKMRG